MYALFTETVSRLVQALVVAVSAFVFHLNRRVQRLETKEEVRAALDELQKETEQKKAERLEEQLEKAVTSLSTFTTLVERVETLLETGLKRLDILEKHVFKL